MITNHTKPMEPALTRKDLSSACTHDLIPWIHSFLVAVFVGLRDMDTGKPLKSCLKKVSNIDGKILGKDGKPMKVVRNVQTNATVSSGVSSGFSDMNQSECAAPIQNVEYHATSSQDEHQHQSNNSNNDQVMQGSTDGIMNNSVNGTKQLFTSIFKATIATKIVLLNEMKNDEAVQGTNVAIHLPVAEEISNRFQNTLYGYFIGKRLAFPLVENYVKNAWAKFDLERSMLVNSFFFF
ncbi:hypothetical protein Tco_0734939 [Tanacetum coccineum]